MDALGQVEVGGTDRHLVGAGEHHLGGDRAGGDVGTVLIRFTRSVNTGLPPARTSTAGAAASWRTVSRACPAATWEVSLTYGVSRGLPHSSR